ncbi:hypothetical protein BDW68DRAFT_71608 [Aspergillus falconensis]
MCYSVVLVCFLTALYFLYAISFPFSLFPLIPALARTIDYPLRLKNRLLFSITMIFLYCFIPASSPFAVEISIYTYLTLVEECIFGMCSRRICMSLTRDEWSLLCLLIEIAFTVTL